MDINQKNIPHQEENRAPHRTKLLVCMDSNQKFIDRRRFWTVKGTTWKFCPGMDEVKTLIHNQQFNDLEAIIISCGVNDVDKISGRSLAANMLNLINEIKQLYPNVKIIVSEITPRKDHRDREVQISNEELSKNTEKLPNVYIVEHRNLRDPDWKFFYDYKHIKKDCIPKFVANFKEFSEKHLTPNLIVQIKPCKAVPIIMF